MKSQQYAHSNTPYDYIYGFYIAYIHTESLEQAVVAAFDLDLVFLGRWWRTLLKRTLDANSHTHRNSYTLLVINSNVYIY